MTNEGTRSLFDAPVVPPSVGDDKREINAMNYETMRRLVCTAPLYHPLFRGEVGRYFHASMKQKRHVLTDDMRAAIHHQVGF